MKRRWWIVAATAVVIAAVVAVAVISTRPDMPVSGRPTAADGTTGTTGSSAPSGTAPTPADPSTAFAALLQTTGPDGTIGLQQAQQSFAYLFGPIPGVALPPGLPDPTELRLSGTGALRSMLAHWAELTTDQQLAVSRIALPPAGEQPRLRPRSLAERAEAAARAADKDTAAAVLRPVLDSLSGQVSSKLGGQIIPSPQLYLVDTEVEGAYAWALGLAAGEAPDDLGRNPITPNGGPAVACNLYLPPSAWESVGTAVPAALTATLAHELVHCYQNYSYPTLTAQRAAPSWLIEGTAEFGGIDITGNTGTVPSNWTIYLTQQAPLFERTYTAMGWWFQLQHIGRDPWAVFPKIWSGAQDSVPAYLTAGGDRDDIYDTWASTLVRQPAFGDAWEVHGKAVSGETPPIETIPADGGTVQSPAFDIRVAKISSETTAGVGDDTIVRITASNPLRMHDSAGFEEVHFTQGDYCLGGTCVCPENTERAGDEITRVSAPLFLGVPGGETGNGAIADTMSLQEYCRRKPPQRPPPPGELQPAPEGSTPHAPPDNPNTLPDPAEPAGSRGDPHLTSFDGRDFAFQAAGEFTLALSDSNDLEVQARQEPLRNADGSENLSVTVTIAVAASVAGDRISITSTPERSDIRLDGVRTDVRERTTLPGGGTIEPITGGFQVGWPDGDILVVLPNGTRGLNLQLTPANGRLGTVQGMLGPYENVPRNPAMQDRAGTRYPSVVGDAPTDPLYTVVGESWRVSQEQSLFDYEPGQSTATFTRRDVPDKLVNPADLAPEAMQAAALACQSVAEADRDSCEYDVAVSQDTGFADGYVALAQLASNGGDVSLGQPVPAGTVEPGETISFTLPDNDIRDLYFASTTDCAASLTVFWRVTAPDGSDTLQNAMCADHGRVPTTAAGTWTVEVFVDAGAEEGGAYGFVVTPAGPVTDLDLTIPSDVLNGQLQGPAATDRYAFSGLQGDVLTVTALPGCDPDTPLLWGLEDPNGYIVTLRTSACADLGEQTLTTNGQWRLVVWNPTALEVPLSYGFAVRE